MSVLIFFMCGYLFGKSLSSLSFELPSSRAPELPNSRAIDLGARPSCAHGGHLFVVEYGFARGGRGCSMVGVLRRLVAHSPRDGDDHGESLGEPVEFEAGVGTEQVLQPHARRRDAEAFLQRVQR